jgi:uncharacterized protein (UPF0248 family)
MTDDEKLMQQALDALQYHYKGRPEDYEVIYNLRTRLAQSKHKIDIKKYWASPNPWRFMP